MAALGFLVGSAYAISAGLLVYMNEMDIDPVASDPGPWLISWAIAGLFLAILSIFFGGEKKKP
jgi:hypothetical protein